MVDALKLQLLPSQQIESRHRTANTDAYTQYLLGNQNRMLDTTESNSKALAAYETAVEQLRALRDLQTELNAVSDLATRCRLQARMLALDMALESLRGGGNPLSEGIHAREVLDSRGNPTVAVTVATSFGAVEEAMVPSGAWVPGSHFGYRSTVSGPMPLMCSWTRMIRRSKSEASTCRLMSPGYGRSTGGAIGLTGHIVLGPGLLPAAIETATQQQATVAADLNKRWSIGWLAVRFARSIGEHERQHRKHEQIQISEEAVEACLAVHVADCKDMDQ